MPVTLSFETAFFTQLPAREYLYGMESSPRDRLALRRFGYHGLYHEAACRHVGRLRGGAGGSGCRVASLCLEAQPELTAVVGSRPLTVTSGATPLEGLPGQTTCGELDPSIVLAMSSRLHLGAEQVNEILTRRSGIAALAGKPVSLESVLDPSSPHRLARDVLRYRILQSCGAAIAAMGGLDAIVFSGQYAQSGRTLGPWLLRKLAACCDDAATAGCEVLDVELHRIVADEAHCAVAEQNACHGAGRPAAVA